MSANQKNSNEGTDLNEVIHKAKKQLLEGQEAGTAEKKTIKVSDKQKAAAILGTVLLGGSAFVAVDQINGQVVEPQVAPADSTQVSTGSSIPGVTAPVSTEPIAVGVTQPVAGGTICPTEDIQIASGVTDSMSFSEAFASAREEVGPGGVFTWHGTTYNTFVKEEWNQIGLADKQEFLHNIGYKVEVPEERDVTDNHPVEVPDKVDGEVDPVDNNPPAIDWASADVKETMIDGKLAYVLDSDKDGIVDAIVIPDEGSNQTVVLLDESGDGSLDTMIVMDSSMQPIASEPMDKPIELTMAEIDLYNESNDNDVILEDETEAQAFEQEVEEELEEDGDVVDSDESISMSGDYTNDDDVEDIS